MRCTTNSEVSEWLRQHAIPPDPYHHGQAPAHYLQFRAPSYHRVLDAFTRHYYEQIIPASHTTVRMTDWSQYQPSEMIAILGIRSNANELRKLIEAPGHHLTPEESETGISLFSLSASFGWSSYLYSPTHRSTLYNWEGSIFDFWTDSRAAIENLKSLLEQFGLDQTPIDPSGCLVNREERV